jgi:hypothetical protein
MNSRTQILALISRRRRIFIRTNGQHKVVVDPSVEAFHNKFNHSYAGNDISLFYGVAP